MNEKEFCAGQEQFRLGQIITWLAPLTISDLHFRCSSSKTSSPTALPFTACPKATGVTQTEESQQQATITGRTKVTLTVKLCLCGWGFPAWVQLPESFPVSVNGFSGRRLIESEQEGPARPGRRSASTAVIFWFSGRLMVNSG